MLSSAFSFVFFYSIFDVKPYILCAVGLLCSHVESQLRRSCPTFGGVLEVA